MGTEAEERLKIFVLYCNVYRTYICFVLSSKYAFVIVLSIPPQFTLVLSFLSHLRNNKLLCPSSDSRLCNS